jgi:hypothetical protein
MRTTSRLALACGVALALGISGHCPDAAAGGGPGDPGAQKAPHAATRQGATEARAPELPKLTAEQIAQRNAQARGGLTAWRALSSIQFQGQMDIGGAHNARVPFTLQVKRPHSERLTIEFQGRTAVQVFDGQNGWKVRPFLNRNDVEPFSDEEREKAARQDELDGPLIDYAARGSRLELEGTEIVEGRPHYRLTVTRQDGYARHVWVDGATFMETKVEGNPRRLDGRMRRVENYLRDYRKIGDVLIPFVSETRVEGARQAHQMTLEKVLLNPPLDDHLFAKPAVAAGPAAAQALAVQAPALNPAASQ